MSVYFITCRSVEAKLDKYLHEHYDPVYELTPNCYAISTPKLADEIGNELEEICTSADDHYFIYEVNKDNFCERATASRHFFVRSLFQENPFALS